MTEVCSEIEKNKQFFMYWFKTTLKDNKIFSEPYPVVKKKPFPQTGKFFVLGL